MHPETFKRLDPLIQYFIKRAIEDGIIHKSTLNPLLLEYLEEQKESKR